MSLSGIFSEPLSPVISRPPTPKSDTQIDKLIKGEEKIDGSSQWQWGWGQLPEQTNKNSFEQVNISTTVNSSSPPKSKEERSGFLSGIVKTIIKIISKDLVFFRWTINYYLTLSVSV